MKLTISIAEWWLTKLKFLVSVTTYAFRLVYVRLKAMVTPPNLLASRTRFSCYSALRRWTYAKCRSGLKVWGMSKIIVLPLLLSQQRIKMETKQTNKLF